MQWYGKVRLCDALVLPGLGSFRSAMVCHCGVPRGHGAVSPSEVQLWHSNIQACYAKQNH
jgi:hypothetical protein